MLNSSILESGTARQRMGGSNEGKYKHSVGETEQVISVEWKHRTRMDHIMSTPLTYPMTQVDHTAMFVVVKE
jgi:hypothetical protein